MLVEVDLKKRQGKAILLLFCLLALELIGGCAWVGACLGEGIPGRSDPRNDYDWNSKYGDNPFATYPSHPLNTANP